MRRSPRLLLVFWLWRLQAVVRVVALLIAVLISDLVQVRLNALVPTRIARRINSRGQDTSGRVLLIAPLSSLVFFLLLPSFLDGLGISFRA